MSTSQDHLDQFFHSFDLSGNINKDKLRQLSRNFGLTDQESDAVFDALDTDKDGLISRQDFCEGFQTSINCERYVSSSPSKLCENNEDDLPILKPSIPVEETKLTKEDISQSWNNFVLDMGVGFYHLTKDNQEQVCDLYQALHGADLPNLLSRFEEIILNVIRDIRKSQLDNERLENSFKREKENHAAHLRQLEEEMEAQMQRVEARVKAEMRDKHDTKKKKVPTATLR